MYARYTTAEPAPNGASNNTTYQLTVWMKVGQHRPCCTGNDVVFIVARSQFKIRGDLQTSFCGVGGGEVLVGQRGCDSVSRRRCYLTSICHSRRFLCAKARTSMCSMGVHARDKSQVGKGQDAHKSKGLSKAQRLAADAKGCVRQATGGSVISKGAMFTRACGALRPRVTTRLS